MPKPYSNDLRRKVVEAYERGEGSIPVIAKRFAVSVSFIRKLRRRYRETGHVEPKPHGGGHLPAFSEEKRVELQSLVKQDSDATLEELRSRSGVVCSLETVSQTLKRMGMTRKKNTGGLGAEEESGS